MAKKLTTARVCDHWFDKLKTKLESSPSFLEKIITSNKGENPYEKGENFILFKLGFYALLYSKGEWLEACSRMCTCLNIRDSNVKNHAKTRLRNIVDTVFTTKNNLIETDTLPQKPVEQKPPNEEITVFEVKQIHLGENDPDDELYTLFPTTVGYYSNGHPQEGTITCRVFFKQEIIPGSWTRTPQNFWVKA